MRGTGDKTIRCQIWLNTETFRPRRQVCVYACVCVYDLESIFSSDFQAHSKQLQVCLEWGHWQPLKEAHGRRGRWGWVGGGGRLSDSDLHLISAARQVFQERGNNSHLFTSSFFHNCLSSHLARLQFDLLNSVCIKGPILETTSVFTIRALACCSRSFSQIRSRKLNFPTSEKVSKVKKKKKDSTQAGNYFHFCPFGL